MKLDIAYHRKLQLLERGCDDALQEGFERGHENLSSLKPQNNWLVKQLLTPSEAAELVRISHPLGPDFSVDSRTKSICYFMIGMDGKFRQLIHNYFNQPKVYNDNPRQSAKKRAYELLSETVITSSPMVKILQAFQEKFSLGPGTIVLINLQTTTEEGMNGDVTGQGIHTDGADNAMIICLQRHNVAGAVTEVFEDVDGAIPLMPPTILNEGDAVLFRDNRVYHNVTHISPENPNQGPAVRTVMTLHSDASYLLEGVKNENNNLTCKFCE